MLWWLSKLLEYVLMNFNKWGYFSWFTRFSPPVFFVWVNMQYLLDKKTQLQFNVKRTISFVLRFVKQFPANKLLFDERVPVVLYFYNFINTENKIYKYLQYWVSNKILALCFFLFLSFLSSYNIYFIVCSGRSLGFLWFCGYST